MNIHHFSGLARPIRFSDRTNRLIIILCGASFFLAGGLLFFVDEQEPGRAALAGTEVGIAVFLGWALSRELDPDRPWTAFAGVGILLLSYSWWFPEVEILLLFTLLLLLRLVNRSSGSKVRPADVLFILALNAFLLYQGFWLMGLACMAAFWINSRLPNPQPGHKIATLFSGVLFLTSLYLKPWFESPVFLSPEVTILVIALSTTFAFYIRQLKTINSTGDITDHPLFPQRVRSAQLLAPLLAVAFTLWNGNVALGSILPLWAALAGTGLWNILIIKKKERNYF